MASDPSEPMRKCPKCDGSGRQFDTDASGGHFDDCDACHGAGEVRDLATNARKRESESKPSGGKA